MEYPLNDKIKRDLNTRNNFTRRELVKLLSRSDCESLDHWLHWECDDTYYDVNVFDDEENKDVVTIIVHPITDDGEFCCTNCDKMLAKVYLNKSYWLAGDDQSIWEDL